MTALTKVSIICTVFNQEDYVIDSLNSVLNQNYSDLELIIINNGSKDNSQRQIENWLEENSDLVSEFIFIKEPISYCSAFNMGLRKSTGEFIMDLSGDDLICEGHIQKSVELLNQHREAAFCFSDAILFDEKGKRRNFYKRDAQGNLKEEIEDGDMYLQIIKGNPISAATALFDSQKLKASGGYDESLSYEDFDILIRLTRAFPVVFSDHIGVQKRIHSKAFSADQYLPKKSKMLPSTVAVCRKIRTLNRNREEDQALLERVLFECKHALWSANFDSAEALIIIAKAIEPSHPKLIWYRGWLRWKLDLSWLYPTITSIRSTF